MFREDEKPEPLSFSSKTSNQARRDQRKIRSRQPGGA
jgi:hypothetical protein